MKLQFIGLIKYTGLSKCSFRFIPLASMLPSEEERQFFLPAAFTKVITIHLGFL